MEGYNCDRFLRNNLGGFGLGLFGSGYRAMMGMCELSNEPLGTLRSRHFLYSHSAH
jgi:hypothetical protein